MSEKHSFNLSDQAHEIIEGIKWGDKSEWVSEAILLKRQMFDLEWTPRPPLFRRILARIWPFDI